MNSLVESLPLQGKPQQASPSGEEPCKSPQGEWCAPGDISEPELEPRCPECQAGLSVTPPKTAPLSYLQLNVVCLRTTLTCISWYTDSVWSSLCCRYHIHYGNLFLSPRTEHFCTFNFYNLPLCIWENTENQDIFFFNSLKNKVKARSCELQSSQSYLFCVHGCDCLSGVVRLDGEEGYCGRDSRDWLTSELAMSGFSRGGAWEKRGES